MRGDYYLVLSRVSYPISFSRNKANLYQADLIDGTRNCQHWNRVVMAATATIQLKKKPHYPWRNKGTVAREDRSPKRDDISTEA